MGCGSAGFTSTVSATLHRGQGRSWGGCASLRQLADHGRAWLSCSY